MDEISGLKTSVESSLIHEFQHAYDFDTGKMIDEIGNQPMSKLESEKRAVFVENIIRRIQNYPRRENY